MSYMHNDIFDGGLQVLTDDTDQLWLVSGTVDPVDYAAAVAARCGVKDSPVISAPQDGAPSGRTVTIDAITDGEVTASSAGATRWLLVDTVGERVLTCRKLVTAMPTYIGNTFALGALTITIPDPDAD